VLVAGSQNILIGVNSAVTAPGDTSNYFGLGGAAGPTFSATGMDTTTPSWSFLGTVTIPQMNVGVAAGPTIRSGTGAASGTQPSGSLWMRTDGAAGTRLYVSQGAGSWLPVAGV
jgi:hypothetical protein